MAKNKLPSKVLHSFFWPFMLLVILVFFMLTNGEKRLIQLDQFWTIVFYIIAALTILIYMIESGDQ